MHQRCFMASSKKLESGKVWFRWWRKRMEWNGVNLVVLLSQTTARGWLYSYKLLSIIHTISREHQSVRLFLPAGLCRHTSGLHHLSPTPIATSLIYRIKSSFLPLHRGGEREKECGYRESRTASSPEPNKHLRVGAKKIAVFYHPYHAASAGGSRGIRRFFLASFPGPAC